MTAGGTWGFLLTLLTESFAVRALLGSAAAALVAALAWRLVRGRGARRTLVVAPAAVAAVAAVGVAVAGEAYLPQLWVSADAGTPGQLVQLLGEWRTQRELEVLGLAWAGVAAVLLCRRLAGLRAVRRLLERASPVTGGTLGDLVERLAPVFGLRRPRTYLLPSCPGGAFAAGVRRPLLVVDPRLLDDLDARELEGVVAHELAHLSRRDPLTSLAVGVVRDVAFFVPPLHLAARWLRREQEEGADELAAARTGRPASLASGILKVLDAGARGRTPRVACAAVALRPSPAYGYGAPPARAVTARVERLLDAPVAPGACRRTAEVVLSLLVLAVAAAVATLVPGWIAVDLNAESLSFGYLAEAPVAPAESPALATFRALTTAPTGAASAPGARRVDDACPCVETQAQLAAGTPALGRVQAPSMLWRAGEDHAPWQVTAPPRGDDVRAARPLWTLTHSGPQVGFFVTARMPGEDR